jgi:hypothetical protein
LLTWKDEALHLVLEALNGVVGKDEQAAARWEPHITPPLLQIWAHNFSDPLIALDTVDIFNSLASVPAALPSLQVSPLPILGFCSRPINGHTSSLRGHMTCTTLQGDIWVICYTLESFQPFLCVYRLLPDYYTEKAAISSRSKWVKQATPCLRHPLSPSPSLLATINQPHRRLCRVPLTPLM